MFNWLLLSLTAATLVGCSADEPAVETAQPQTWHVSIAADDGTTRSVKGDGSGGLVSIWQADQRVEAYDASGNRVGSLTASESATGTTTITGDISGTYTAGTSTLTLYSPAKPTSATYAEYATQDGTVDGISKKDYLTATVTVTAIDAVRGLLATGSAAFKRRQSFTKFAFSEAVKTVKISASGMSDITVTATGDQRDFYVALPLAGSVSYTFLCTTSGGVEYRGTKTGPLTHGDYYSTDVTIAPGIGFTNTSTWGNENSWPIGDIYF